GKAEHEAKEAKPARGPTLEPTSHQADCLRHVGPQGARRFGPCIHELFEHRVDQTPKAVAVVWEGQRLSYHELNRRANDLAWKLRNLGVASNTLVGLHAEPSLELVIGVLGILKAGGAYVP